MIDMNGSIESIMQECDRIAFNEFKSDVDLYYKERRAAEHQSGMHGDRRGFVNYGKRAERTRDYGSGTFGGRRDDDEEKPVDKRDKNYIDHSNRRISRDVDNNIYGRKNTREYNKRHPEEAKKSAQAMRKAKHESASIFDTLLDQV